MWLKADVILPYDWETDTVPAQFELEFGMNVNKKVALYVDGIAGLGHDRLIDWGVGVGLRIKY
jgi:outer membrane phospholipase A